MSLSYARAGVTSVSESTLVFAATAPRVNRPATTPAAAAKARKVPGRRRANRLTSSNRSAGSWLSSQCENSATRRDASWARSVIGPDSSDCAAIEPNSDAQPLSFDARFDCWFLAWPRSSDRVWSTRFLVWYFASSATWVASPLATSFTPEAASAAVSLTLAASLLAVSTVESPSDSKEPGWSYAMLALS